MRVASCALAAALLTSCSSYDNSDLNRYVAQVKARPGGHIEPVPEFKTYETYAYPAKDRRSPFQQEQVKSAVATTGTSTKGPHPDLNRRREALESFPLDTLKLVGQVEKKGELWAVVTAPDGLVYRVQVGNHMGQNHGKITRITEDKVYLTEIVPDGSGGWIERQASLALAQ